MADNNQTEVRQDVSGYEVITTALMELLNGFPGLRTGEEITFSVLGETSGRAMFPAAGAIIQNERRDILGNVTQVCLYPFTVVYRAAGLSESRKTAVKEWLDNLGCWLEGQTVTINNTEYTLEEYPALTGSRRFTEIVRTTPAYLDSVNENMSENWVIGLSAHYQNQFKRRITNNG